MIKEYRKTATIKAERFGGGHEQVKKYGIQDKATLGEVYSGNRWTILTKEGPMIVNVGDWIATNDDGLRWVINDDWFRSEYEEVES
ncbi:hypothetical protein GBO41_09515 [Pediococcus acidilactici]|uniref:hypothetical protein n=1 Tax=Pediococcus acidilactici TaxID=1254 RepID=UPI00110895DF|nr:hypothetical protein [Pediococcus acidilactici]KAF0342455.1 hypothetical protein GBO41_09515 [Pediococcus acidilactici]TLQ00609.1 hypothetical protein FEZ49_02660 [Pediococcus acidilactici]